MKVSNLDIPVGVKITGDMIPSLQEATSEYFRCRDPYILPYDGKYYFYCGSGEQGVGCYVSDDLVHWSERIIVYKKPENFHGVHSLFWAPECHYWKGNFYIFTSVGSSLTGHRSISVYRSASPLGPFEDIAGGYISPKDWDAIDGTLYVDKNGDPWMVFVHEWTSMPDHNGGMVAARLSDDFTHLISEPVNLFYARDPKWATSGVTDGPYLYTMDNGHLLMIWSNFTEKGYVVAIVHSTTDEITGPWEHAKQFLYQRDLRPDFKYDGGHAMIFKDFNGQTKIAFHGPNGKQPDDIREHLHVYSIVEKDGTIVIE